MSIPTEQVEAQSRAFKACPEYRHLIGPVELQSLFDRIAELEKELAKLRQELAVASSDRDIFSEAMNELEKDVDRLHAQYRELVEAGRKFLNDGDLNTELWFMKALASVDPIKENK